MWFGLSALSQLLAIVSGPERHYPCMTTLRHTLARLPSELWSLVTVVMETLAPLQNGNPQHDPRTLPLTATPVMDM